MTMQLIELKQIMESFQEDYEKFMDTYSEKMRNASPEELIILKKTFKNKQLRRFESMNEYGDAFRLTPQGLEESRNRFIDSYWSNHDGKFPNREQIQKNEEVREELHTFIVKIRNESN